MTDSANNLPDAAGDFAPADGGLPEAATRRMGEGAFTSGLTVPDFAACLQMGLQPVGFVQGSCVMQWRWYGMVSGYGLYGQMGVAGGQRSGYQQSYPCPHGFVSADHRLYGQNLEQPWIEDAWQRGFSAAYERMIEEGRLLGAHGVVGVVDTCHSLTDMGVLEFRLRGTAVQLEGEPPPSGDGPWTTYLAGQRLAKMIEAGFAPVSVIATVSSVRVWASCVTEYLARGSTATMWGSQVAGSEISQVAEAHMAVRQLARERVRSQLGSDSLRGASMVTTATEGGEDAELECILRGNRVRRFKKFEALAPPRPTVRLQ